VKHGKDLYEKEKNYHDFNYGKRVFKNLFKMKIYEI
jgi:hypothetical protein